MSGRKSIMRLVQGVIGLVAPSSRRPATLPQGAGNIYVNELDGHVHVRHSDGSDVDLEDAGASGPSTAEKEVVFLNFAYNTSSPAVVFTFAANERLLQADVTIETAFDDVAATLRLRKNAAGTIILDTDEIGPTDLSTFSSETPISMSASDTLRLEIAPGTSTQGSGYITAIIQRA